MERCTKCSKKMVISFDCKCKQIYCMKCRLPEVHNCIFDFKKDGKEFLEKTLVHIENNRNFEKIEN